MRKYDSGMRWAFWRWTEVAFDRRPYLRRLHLLKTPLFSVMLHWILRADPQRDPHDHPVSFVSFVLRGWYKEIVGAYTRHTRAVTLCNFKRAKDAHRIVEVAKGGCITLVIAGPKVRDWVYWTHCGPVSWRKYQR